MGKDRVEPLIGGFPALEPMGSGGLQALWQIDPALAWGNATSALAALLTHLKPARVWLPGYFCAPVLEAVPVAARRFFPVTPDLQPDLTALTDLSPGDVLVAVDYFGRAPGPAWRDFTARHPGVTFIEDRAQALDPGDPPWGDWLLFSPRKLFGVAEGGFLVPATPKAKAQSLPDPTMPANPATSAKRLAPLSARAAAPDRNDLWYPLYQQAEAGQTASPHRISDAALAHILSLDPAPAIAARKANFAHLAKALPDLALIPDTEPRFAPMGFPILLPPASRDTVQRALAAQGIFAAVHWRDIAAPPDFAHDHDLARRLMTLPVDARYGAAEMDRVVRAVRKAMT